MAGSKEVIRDAAVALFNERGYDRVSLRDIAREAGVAIGSLTYHYRRKEDLLDAILRDLHSGFEGAFDDSARGEELLAHLVGLFREGERNQARYPFYFENVTQVAQCSERIAQDARSFEEGLYRHYRACLARLAEDGALRPGMGASWMDSLALSMVTLQAGWSMGAGPHANGVGPEVSVSAALTGMLAGALNDEWAGRLDGVWASSQQG